MLGQAFSEAQSIVANATTVVSTNTVDLGALVENHSAAFGTDTAKNQFAPNYSPNLHLYIGVVVAASAGTALYLDLTDCSTVGGTYQVTGIGVHEDNSILQATLVAGFTILDVPLPAGLQRFLQILYTTTGDHTGSTLTVNAHLTMGRQSRNVAPHRI